VAKSVVYEIVR
jgi:hypothetical protein